MSESIFLRLLLLQCFILLKSSVCINADSLAPGQKKHGRHFVVCGQRLNWICHFETSENSFVIIYSNFQFCGIEFAKKFCGRRERHIINFPSVRLSPFLGLTNDRIKAALLLLRSSIQPGKQAGGQDWVEAKNKISAIELRILNLNWGPSFYMDIFTNNH